ncbi:hypothetical protein OAF54_01030 [bacterium]|nr:hypothetical protein [bacterium]
MSNLQMSEVITDNINIENWGCGGNSFFITEELKKAVNGGRANLPIEHNSYGSDGFSRKSPEEATTIYYTMFLGSYSDCEETIVKISLKACVNDIMDDIDDVGLDRLEKDMLDILGDIQAEQKKRMG